MKKVLITLLFVLSLAFNSTAQIDTDEKSYVILPTSIITNIDVYASVLDKADLEMYRYKTKNDTILFEDGVKLVIFSARQLKMSGINNHIDINAYSDYRDKDYTNPVFRLIIPTGVIPQVPGQQPYIVALYTHKEK
jgi:hypothetical protein